MMLFRPVQHKDLGDILNLSSRAGVGLTTLPNNQEYLAARISRSIDSFNDEKGRAQQGFLFTLEDTEKHRVVGVSALEVAVGLEEPFYNFRVQKLVRASRELGVYNAFEILNVEQDYTGCSELCTLFLDPEYQKGRNGLFLSRSRFLFISAFRHLFSKTIFAEMRGVANSQGESPFWNALGQHFFNVPFSEADYLTVTGSKTFIAELMPYHPIYVPLLPEEARQAIGQVHKNTLPARIILEKEGFAYHDTVDIFDAGAILDAEIDNVRTVKASRIIHAKKSDHVSRTEDGVQCLVSNLHFQDFKAILLNISDPMDGDELRLTPAEMDALHVNDGEPVRFVSLFS
ncbi:arginine N-succinyltransferase [Xenorhabdus szentirmaii]|uniref:Arginine N-succinyltransferase n=2 Tax=Xenorhabdus szentirmaii TaxID=290112 RepID=W1IVT5_9GAMM|nr:MULTISPECIES: arginine N-succinyltransferase [Xenorhabdus]MBD2780557.1 arginine N-succinyltransferase [Xenorhabdus sp. 38]MBD2792991.1 arginine N-succinyltransferase [Xenorhabdus sp. CUL]MBD2801827.1 arginine N-succinyltransferase [Xenorhabdus sp. M]MBD2805626.1 arginine N-succinyltransferase [Xenorhabdus sp. ZM]MBD2820842.1 arginine N-succinyltransferase [Xenorhabdus sp. 42]